MIFVNHCLWLIYFRNSPYKFTTSSKRHCLLLYISHLPNSFVSLCLKMKTFPPRWEKKNIRRTSYSYYNSILDLHPFHTRYTNNNIICVLSTRELVPNQPLYNKVIRYRHDEGNRIFEHNKIVVYELNCGFQSSYTDVFSIFVVEI